ncbi:hypothetical protein L207DRAFT_631217 [Hyaloscypha variabilis F]|uniref:Mg2+ transporter protein, CorA-like/Zinc transport protein ZntB n=1 Tax=Hyaloscypha variabilis (strain UAMH 11265 / GT02V1 / F) TaxID=1149755 RepID=A0A2J6RX20_HYAVF|nr:hypothetical protein L207DRAFT_631217 [Hyaloscypha variabilis F]
MPVLTKCATASDVDKALQKSLRYLACGGPAGVDAPLATLAPRTRLMSMVTVLVIVKPPHSSAFGLSSANELFDTWFRFLVKQAFETVPQGEKDYVWYKFNIFTCWNLNTNRSIILVFDLRPAIKGRLPSPLLDSIEMGDMIDPYWIHAIFADELVRLQDEAVWGIRNLVRKIEVNRTTSTAPNPNYPALHDIARHAIHISETLDTGVKTIEMMMSEHDQFLADRENADRNSKKTGKRIQKRISFHHLMLSSLRSRSLSTKERLLNEIQLAYNVVAQYDSQISVEIGRAAHADSAAMKTIAFLTLTFFPATFISAIFSMSFFNYNPESDEWTVSKEFWIYWVVAIPITCITALMWSSWHKLFPMKQIGDGVLQPRGEHMAKHNMQSMAVKLRAKFKDSNVGSRV